MKLCTGVDNNSVTSNIGKRFPKSNDVTDTDTIMLKPLSLCRKIPPKIHESHVINGRITVKFCTRVAHDKPIPRTKQNTEFSTDIIMLKFERLRRKALNLKRIYSVVCGHCKNCCGY